MEFMGILYILVSGVNQELSIPLMEFLSTTARSMLLTIDSFNSINGIHAWLGSIYDRQVKISFQFH